MTVKKRLSEIVEIRNGYQFRGKVTPATPAITGRGKEPSGIVHVIQLKDIDDNRHLNTSYLVLVRLPGHLEKYEVRQDDVLFLARGQRLYATAIVEALRNTVATGYFFILRPTAHVRSRYLAWYLNQPPFQSVLRTFMKGTHQPLVSRKDIENMEVEIPPLGVQEAIAALEDLRIIERQLSLSLQEKRTQLVRAISMQAARRSS
jgi:restriction endonuclease S subunit